MTFMELAAGGYHVVARLSDGSVIGWGQNAYGQCYAPMLPAGVSYLKVAAAGMHSVGRTDQTFAVVPFCFGDGGNAPCPCGNSGLPGHGCDNSSSTGGALLVGTGQALLSGDTLQLTASNERTTAFSLFWQGDQAIAERVFGDGLGCMGGHLKRLFHHSAVGGVVSAPQGADLSVSARSAAVGNPIAPGTIRVYHVFYRDPDPNFCPEPAGATFNATNGLRVLWGQ
jgi:hypothetical protein